MARDNKIETYIKFKIFKEMNLKIHEIDVSIDYVSLEMLLASIGVVCVFVFGGGEAPRYP